MHGIYDSCCAKERKMINPPSGQSGSMDLAIHVEILS